MIYYSLNNSALIMHFPISIRKTTEKWGYWGYFETYSIDNQKFIGRSIVKNGPTLALP